MENTIFHKSGGNISWRQGGAQVVDCPFCNHRFDETSEDCHAGCPGSVRCPLIKCPNCNYEFVIESKTVDFVKKIFSKKEGKSGPGRSR